MVLLTVSPIRGERNRYKPVTFALFSVFLFFVFKKKKGFHDSG